jgi:nitrite reductase (NADH) small subunit/3-phenylpropionate/trans-cinnamate dioxygenase ferredoxin subunit
MKDETAHNFRTVCRTGDVPEGEGRMFIVAETMVAVFNVQGSFFALANECPHAGASLAYGIIEGDIVHCRIHHWRFSIRDGTYLDENEPLYNAQSYPVRVVGEEVEVSVVTNPS